MPIVALVSRACRRSHEYSGDPFDPRRLLTVALYDNCSSQIALSSALVRGGFWDLANCETWYSKTRGRVGSIFRPATPHPKESWRRRGAVQLASRTAHTRRQRNSTDRRIATRLSVPAAPVRGTNHDVSDVQRSASSKVCSSNCIASAPRARGPDARRITPAHPRRRIALRDSSQTSEKTADALPAKRWARAREPNH